MKYPAHTGHWPLPSKQGETNEMHLRCSGCGLVVKDDEKVDPGQPHKGCHLKGKFAPTRGQGE